MFKLMKDKRAAIAAWSQITGMVSYSGDFTNNIRMIVDLLERFSL